MKWSIWPNCNSCGNWYPSDHVCCSGIELLLSCELPMLWKDLACLDWFNGLWEDQRDISPCRSPLTLHLCFPAPGQQVDLGSPVQLPQWALRFDLLPRVFLTWCRCLMFCFAVRNNFNIDQAEYAALEFSALSLQFRSSSYEVQFSQHWQRLWSGYAISQEAILRIRPSALKLQEECYGSQVPVIPKISK